MKNIIERPVVPYNPPAGQLKNKEQYSLFAPIAANGRVGMAGFDTKYFDINNQIVSLKERYRKTLFRIVDLSIPNVLPPDIIYEGPDGRKTTNVIYHNYTNTVVSHFTPSSTEKVTRTGTLIVLSYELPTDSNIEGVRELFITQDRIYTRWYTVANGMVPVLSDFYIDSNGLYAHFTRELNTTKTALNERIDTTNERIDSIEVDLSNAYVMGNDELMDTSRLPISSYDNRDLYLPAFMGEEFDNKLHARASIYPSRTENEIKKYANLPLFDKDGVLWSTSLDKIHRYKIDTNLIDFSSEAFEKGEESVSPVITGHDLKEILQRYVPTSYRFAYDDKQGILKLSSYSDEDVKLNETSIDLFLESAIINVSLEKRGEGDNQTVWLIVEYSGGGKAEIDVSDTIATNVVTDEELDAIVVEINAQISNKISELDGRLTKAINNTSERLTRTEIQLDNKITETQENIQQAIDDSYLAKQVATSLKADFDDYKEDLNEVVDDLDANLSYRIGNVQNNVNNVSSRVTTLENKHVEREYNLTPYDTERWWRIAETTDPLVGEYTALLQVSAKQIEANTGISTSDLIAVSGINAGVPDILPIVSTRYSGGAFTQVRIWYPKTIYNKQKAYLELQVQKRTDFLRTIALVNSGWSFYDSAVDTTGVDLSDTHNKVARKNTTDAAEILNLLNRSSTSSYLETETPPTASNDKKIATTAFVQNELDSHFGGNYYIKVVDELPDDISGNAIYFVKGT